MNSEESFAPGPPTTQVTLKTFAFANLSSMFVLIGATASIYGPLLIRFSQKFHVTLPAAGIVLSIHFVGSFVGVLLGWAGVRRFRGNVVIGATLSCLALGAVVVALANHWDLVLVGVFLVGVGFGGVDFALNTVLARTALKGRAHRLSLANAGYGVGAVIGPLLVFAVHPKNFPLLFGGVAVFAVVLSTLNRGIVAPPLSADAMAQERLAYSRERRPILVTFIIAYVLYTAAETSTSGWIASQLHREGFATSVGSLATGGFWLAMAFGRSMGGPLYKRFSDKSLVLAGLASCIVLSVAAYSHSVAPYVYPLIGLVLASVYPMGLIWYTVLCPHDSNGLALIILFLMGGGIIGPAVESLMVATYGIHAVPLVIAAFAFLDILAFSYALRYKPLAITI
jgi:fucose permease